MRNGKKKARNRRLSEHWLIEWSVDRGGKTSEEIQVMPRRGRVQENGTSYNGKNLIRLFFKGNMVQPRIVCPELSPT